MVPLSLFSIIFFSGFSYELSFLTVVCQQVLAATQRPGVGGQDCWFQGTADAVRQYMWLFEDVKNMDVEDVIILSGDHLYHMDYLKFVQRHKDTDADITISCVPMDYSRASEMHPLIKIDNNGQVIHFNEKPRHESLSSMQVDTTVLGLSPNEAKRKPFIASMGIYVFKKRVLLKLLRWRYPTANDFGSEIIPASIKEFNVQAYLFRDYWEDIGTIKSFFDANLALTEQVNHLFFTLKVKI
jgi:glucose-1-phosphate adenylyltransferase